MFLMVPNLHTFSCLTSLRLLALINYVNSRLSEGMGALSGTMQSVVGMGGRSSIMRRAVDGASSAIVDCAPDCGGTTDTYCAMCTIVPDVILLRYLRQTALRCVVS